jgi:YesN/AraC family two-component response regulator
MVKSVLIADDNAFVRQRLGELFNREPDFEVCAEAENGRKAIEEAQESHPDLILLDLSMPVSRCGAFSETAYARSTDRDVQHLQ